MSADDEVARRLKEIAAILRIAHRDALAAERDDVLEDATNKGILAAASKTWLSTGALQKAAVKKGASSERTVLRRLPELVDRGFLDRREVSGGSVEYRSTGLI